MKSANLGKRKEEKKDPGKPVGGSYPPTPIRISRATRTVIAISVAALILFVCWMVPDALIMLLGGITLAIILSFPVQLLSRFIPRGLAILFSFLLLIALLSLLVASIIPVLVEQFTSLVNAIPGFVNRANETLTDILVPLEERGVISQSPEEFLNDIGSDLVDAAQSVAQGILGGTFGILSSTIGFAIALFGIIFISAYLLVDTRRVKAAFIIASPHRYRRDVRELWHSFGYSLSRYLAGLALSMSVQGLVSALALVALGIPYALLLGLWVAFTAVLPYIGAWLGAIPAVLIALAVSPTQALLVALLFFLIQQLEGNFLTPRIQSQALGVHPIIVFLAVIIGAGMFGILGAIFAVPALAVFRVLFDFFRVRLTTRPTEKPGEPAKDSPGP
ncbi:AI-2E family transporter [Rubrobacter indicoceani]|uniref:AI-2E family transporter n=1 Tax=Rubrobacter indicoceani TaxID=2051957 RepID=UPI000E5B60F2|nr:AI-2E family transporter [Rubrobacter indicoceani]